jgi:hypothetical protein
MEFQDAWASEGAQRDGTVEQAVEAPYVLGNVEPGLKHMRRCSDDGKKGS